MGILAGLLTIGGGFLSVAGVTGPTPPAQGELIAFVHDARSRRPVEATVEILTAQDALVTTLSVEGNGRFARRLKEGQYRLRVTHPAFGTEIRRVEVHAGQRSEVRIPLVQRPAPRVIRAVSTEQPGPVTRFFKDLFQTTEPSAP